MGAAATGAAGVAVDREVALVRAAEERFDVVVVGAGITGAGVALDAALRGYRVGLLDRDDVAAGTSSQSSKLVHGGLRYLATGDVQMVVEGVRERDRTMRMAPHLVRPLAFAVPTPTAADRALLKLGLSVYDGIGTGGGSARHHRLSPIAMRDAAPTLRGVAGGGYRYWDACTDDARLTLAIVQAARARGVLTANHARLERVEVGPAGRVTGAVVTDVLTGSTATWRARWVVAAGGVWAGAVRALAPAGEWQPRVRPARGAHLVFPRERLPLRHAVVFSGPDGRRLFAVPWGRQVYVGTTDVPSDDTLASVTERDVAYLLDAVADSFDDPPDRTDVVGAWAGLRPLAASDDDGDAADLSRRHVVAEDPPGLVHVTGGKLTTWRSMAADVLDEVVAGDGRRARCRTEGVSLGAGRDVRSGRERALAAARSHGLGADVGRSLWRRHGEHAPTVADACAAEPGGLEPLVDGLPLLRGEVVWAVRHELARTATDVLARRTRVALRVADAGTAGALDTVVAVLAEEVDGADPDALRRAYVEEVATLRGAAGPALAS